MDLVQRKKNKKRSRKKLKVKVQVLLKLTEAHLCSKLKSKVQVIVAMTLLRILMIKLLQTCLCLYFIFVIFSDSLFPYFRAHKKFVEHIKDRIVNDSIDSESDEDDEEKSGQKKRDPLKVKGELFIEDLPHIEELKITVPENECLEIGIIVSIVEQLVLVEAYPNTAALDIDSVLFLEAGQKPLGAIFDVIGQVSQPLYCVRFNSVDEIKTRMIDVNQKVYSAPRTEYAQFVVLPTLMKQKGSDASWRNDLEPPNDQKDHSDDEEERLLKRNKKINKNRGSGNDAVQKHLNQNAQMNNSRGGRGGYRGQGRQQWNNNRPSDYHWHNNNMFQQPPPMINYQINGYQGNSFPSLPFPEMWTIHDQNQQKG